jgi:hypothetical protein
MVGEAVPCMHRTEKIDPRTEMNIKMYLKCGLYKELKD